MAVESKEENLKATKSWLESDGGKEFMVTAHLTFSVELEKEFMVLAREV